MGGGYNEASVVPNTEGLQEVRVISNNFSAEYGRGQAVIAMSTKSGTNAFRGQGVYMMRHEGLDANSFSNNAQDIPKREFRVNDAGGTVGGPIIRNKLFFFSSYHGLRNNQKSTQLMTVPTALERVGNFSQTFIRDEAGNPVPARIFDPCNVVQEGPDLFRRVEFPNAIITNPDQFALRMFSYYPQPNRTPDDVFNTEQLRGHDRRRSGGTARTTAWTSAQGSTRSTAAAASRTPRSSRRGRSARRRSTTRDGVRGDKNPYFQIGRRDRRQLDPGARRPIRASAGSTPRTSPATRKDSTTTHVRRAVEPSPLILFPGVAPNVNPNGYGGGQGGGSNWSAMTTGNFNTKREFQTNHSVTGSVTKVRGKWVHKAGGEFRNLLSNYWDPEQGSVAMPSPFAHAGGNFNFQYTTASGGVASLVTTNAQRGVNAAGMLLGTGVWWIRPGANVTPAFSQKYFAFYSQNDWRPTPKLTINLGLRWEVQPGPTERFDRMSSWDSHGAERIRHSGRDRVPRRRRLQPEPVGHRGRQLGSAHRHRVSLNERTVLRGGFGITYLPSNTGYFSGPTDYGSANFSGGVTQTAYGTNPRGVPVIRFSDPAPIAPAIGGNPAAPQVYGIGEARFDRHFQNGQARQWNIFLERSLGNRWTASVGYRASVSRNLLNRSFPIQNLQSMPADTLAPWRQQYIDSNGTLNPATQLVPNPFQPSSGPLLPFAGALGAATIARQNTLFPYPAPDRLERRGQFTGDG